MLHKKFEFLFHGVENIIGKKRKFSAFPTIFSQGFFLRGRSKFVIGIKSFPNNKIKDCNKLKSFTDDNRAVTKCGSIPPLAL